MEIKITLTAKQMQIAFNVLCKFFKTIDYLDQPDFKKFGKVYGGKVEYESPLHFELITPLHVMQSTLRDIINLTRYCYLEDFQKHFEYPEKTENKTEFLLTEMCDLALLIKEEIERQTKNLNNK